MPAHRFDRRYVPAILVVVLGLGLAVVAGAGLYEHSRPKYTYGVTAYDTDDETTFLDGVYETSELSDPARAVVAAAREDTRRIDTSDLDAAPEFDTSRSRYLLRNGSDERCLSVDSTESGLASLGPCMERRPAVEPVYEFAALSDEARAIVRRVLNESDGSFVRYGQTPPEFVGGTDVPALGRGVYVVEADERYYELTVFSMRGPGTRFLQSILLGSLVAGGTLAVAGAVALRRRLVAFPLAVLLGIAPIGASVALSQTSLLSVDAVFENLGMLVFVGGLAFGYAWLILADDDDSVRPTSGK